MGLSIDREKVIRHIAAEISIARTCKKDFASVDIDMLSDAFALLKEQEAVKPIKKDAVEITARYEFDCPCGAPLLIGQPYCADCGKAVNWT